MCKLADFRGIPRYNSILATFSVSWLIEFVFFKFPQNTRHDNEMSRIFNTYESILEV